MNSAVSFSLDQAMCVVSFSMRERTCDMCIAVDAANGPNSALGIYGYRELIVSLSTFTRRASFHWLLLYKMPDDWEKTCGK